MYELVLREMYIALLITIFHKLFRRFGVFMACKDDVTYLSSL